MTSVQTADIVVIGGGIIGTSIAFYLARMGAGRVVLLERKHLAAGATGLSCGLVRQYCDNSLDARPISRSIETFQHFDDVVGSDCAWVSTGLLYLVSLTNPDVVKANVAMLQSLGMNTTWVTAGDVRELAPYLVVDEPTVGVYDQDAG